MPGYRVVELSPVSDATMAEAVRKKATRSLPSLDRLRGMGRESRNAADAVASGGSGAPAAEEDLWGNSSQFALIEPQKGMTRASDAGDTAKRRTVVVSNGKIVTEQG